MAVYLYRLGRFAFRNRWAVLGVWIVMLIGAAVAAQTLSGPTSESFSLPGTPAQNAFDLMAERAPEFSQGEGARAHFVFAAPDGEQITDPQYQQAVEATLDQLRGWPDNVDTMLPDRESAEAIAADQAPVQVRDPFETNSISPNGRVALADVLFGIQAGEISQETRDFLAAVGGPARDAGLQVEVNGDALQPPIEQPASELIGVGVAAVVLTLTFGALVAAGLPLINAIFGVGIATSLITAATGFVDMSQETSILALMLGLAVSIDYALFIVSRHRVEVAAGRSPEEAAGRAVGTAGNAVVFAGTTVIVALAGLSVVGIPFLTNMALAAVVAVFFAVLIAISLLPAFLGIAGKSVLSRKVRKLLKSGTAPADLPGAHHGFAARWGRFVTGRPLIVAVVAIVGLAVIAIPMKDLELGIPGDEVAPESSTQRKAYDLIAENFGPGTNGPLLIVVDIPDGVPAQEAMGAIRTQLSAMDGVANVGRPTVNQDGNLGILSLIPTTGPSSQGTTDLVHAIRDSADELQAATGVAVHVTGTAAILIDVSAKLGDALVPYLIVVVGLALLLLLLVFRSIVVPLKATLGFLLTIGATFGAVVAVFQWGWFADLFGVSQVGPILSFLPIFMIGVVFGLAMDYEFFLVTRMREEHVHGAEPKEAVVNGITFSGRVVTAAAIIMISVFLGFVLGDNATIKSIGFAMAVGVAVDAFVVRLTIVPAVLALLGRSAWWIPRWLNAILPNVDVEGERLRRHVDGAGKPSPQPAE